MPELREDVSRRSIVTDGDDYTFGKFEDGWLVLRVHPTPTAVNCRHSPKWSDQHCPRSAPAEQLSISACNVAAAG